MSKLDQARKEINQIDKEMARLFAARMKAVEQIAHHKKEHGLPILDTAREEEVIRKNAELMQEEALKSYYVSFLKYNMTLSRSYQHRLLEGMRVAYSGVPGAFADIAAKKIFPDGSSVPYKDFKAAYEAVVTGECDCAVLPIENSYAGDVSQVMDLAFFGNLSVNGVYDMEIVQNLIGIEGATVRDVKEVISHPQGLGQCAEYIRDHDFIGHEATNTALAQKKSGWIDFDAGILLSDPDLDKQGQKLLKYVIRVAEGEETCSEKNGYREISIFKDGVTL